MRRLRTKHRSAIAAKRIDYEKKSDQRRDYVSICVALIAVLVAVIAAYYARQQVLVAKETMRRQLRAYVTISLAENPTLVNGMVHLKLKVKNVGATPADHVRLSFILFQHPNLDRALSLNDFVDTDQTTHATAVYILGNNEEYYANVDTSISENNLISNRGEDKLSVFLLKVDYEDVFQNWHMRPYCTYFTPLDFNLSFQALPCNIDDAYGD